MIQRNDRAAFFEALRPQLERRIRQVSRSVSSELEEVSGGEEHHLADVDDLGGDAMDEETTFALMELGYEELEQLRWALTRLDEGSYGACEDCEAPIPLARLRALPLATRCVRCQQRADAEAVAEGEEPARAALRAGHLSDVEDVVLASEQEGEERAPQL